MQENSNRLIDKFILSGSFEIEEQWGIEQLAQYLNELSLLSAGAAYSDLGIGQRRHESRPGIIMLTTQLQADTVRDNINLSDSTIPPGSIAHLRLQGVMRANDGASSTGVNTLIDNIHKANQNPNIQGILLETNTGGGESLSGTMLQSVLADSPKPVVTWAHLLASAGVRATLPADEIIASSESSQIGSIGTFITLDKSFSRWYSAYYEDMYADKSTNKNKEFRAFLDGNKEPLKASINRSNDFFLNEVQTYRQLKRDAEHTLSGAMFYAKEAKSRGLIDGIGNFQYAVKRVVENSKRRNKM